MNNDRECAAYFRSRKAYERCMEELLKKWKSYGKTAGRITLKQTTEEERRAIGGIVGRAFYEETIHFSFSEFEKGLQKTRFAPVNMEKMLEAYAGKSLKTNRELQEEDQFRREKFLKTNQFYFREKAGADSLAFQWIEELLSGKKYGYSLLMREYGKDALQAEEIFRHTGRALIKLEEMETSGESFLWLCLQRSFLIIRTTLTGEQQRDFFLCMPSVSGRNGDCRKIPMSGGSFWRMWELYRTIFLPRFMSVDSD